MVDEFDQFEDSSSPGLGAADYLAIVVRRRWVILLPLFFCWVAVWTMSWFLPATYKSEALILVEQQSVPEQYVVPNVTLSLQERLQNMTQQILSRTRLQATIDRFHLYQGRRAMMQSGDVVERMRSDIKIDLVDSATHPTQLTSFKISYSSGSPELARQVNEELASLFIEENLKFQQQLSESTTLFLKSQLEDAKTKLAQQEAKVRAFKAAHFGDLPSEKETNVQILSGLQNQLLGTQRALDVAMQQKLYFESLQQYQSAQPKTGVTEDPSGTSVPSLNTELIVLRRQLEDARTRHTEEHPDVIALKDKIARKEKLLKDSETDMAAHPDTDKGTDPGESGAAVQVKQGLTAPMMQVQSQLKANSLEIHNYEQHVKELESQISAYRARLNLTPQIEQELAEVSRGYEESKANYDSLVQKQNQSQLATNLQERQQGQQFRVLDPASLPLRPSSPNRLILSLGGLVFGAVIGLALTLLLELRYQVVRKQEDLEGLMPTRVLVGIPHLKIPGEDRLRGTFRLLEIGAVSIMALLILVGNLYVFHKG